MLVLNIFLIIAQFSNFEAVRAWNSSKNENPFTESELQYFGKNSTKVSQKTEFDDDFESVEKVA